MSQTEGWPERLYVGRAEVEEGFVPENAKLEQAIQAAFDDAIGRGETATTFRVAAIYVKRTNPISEYTVVLGAT